MDDICRGLHHKVIAFGKKDSLDLGKTDIQVQIQTASRIRLLNSKYISQYGITTNLKNI